MDCKKVKNSEINWKLQKKDRKKHICLLRARSKYIKREKLNKINNFLVFKKNNEKENNKQTIQQDYE